MVVAVAVVHVVEVAIHEIVDVITVGNSFVAAAFAMDMAGFMTAAHVPASAIGGVRGGYGNRMLVEVPFMRVMQMAIMKIVDMTLVDNGRVSAARAVDVVVIFVDVMIHFCAFLFTGMFSVECARALKIKLATCWSASE